LLAPSMSANASALTMPRSAVAMLLEWSSPGFVDT